MNGPDERYAGTVTVGAKGQIVIPKEVRKMFGIQPGDALLLLADPKQGVALPPKGTLNELLELVLRGGADE